MQTLHLYKQDTVDRIILLQQIIDKKITQIEAAEQLCLTDRQVRRLVKRYKDEGSDGVIPKYPKVSNKRLSREVEQKILQIIKSKYHDFGPTLISEKLLELEGIKISRETIRKWIIADGLWKGKKRKKARIHQSRARRDRFGELVQIDGSPHDLICANSPQAKGRVERANGVLQDRLVKEMRLSNISSIDEGNKFLEAYFPKYNKKFGVEAASQEDAHRPLTHDDESLDLILSIQKTRTLSKNLEFSLYGTKYQILNVGKGYRMRQGKVHIYKKSNGAVSIRYENKELEYQEICTNMGPIIADEKERSKILDDLICVSYQSDAAHVAAL